MLTDNFSLKTGHGLRQSVLTSIDDNTVVYWRLKTAVNQGKSLDMIINGNLVKFVTLEYNRI